MRNNLSQKYVEFGYQICLVCYGYGIEYNETCVTCGGHGIVDKDYNYIGYEDEVNTIFQTVPERNS